MRQAVDESQVSFSGRGRAACASLHVLRQSTALQQCLSRSLARQGRERCPSSADNRYIQADFVGSRASQPIFLSLRFGRFRSSVIHCRIRTAFCHASRACFVSSFRFIHLPATANFNDKELADEHDQDERRYFDFL
ncbi:hypothetical protein [Paraburkholderia sp. EG304]|uniref:hypothetical protein n=1 Tax=Paraburkholderia sp. EG304 TaxID=3237015 RepID=UPI00397993AE